MNLDEFIFAGNILFDIKTKQGFTVEIYERDANMKEAFQVTGTGNRLTKAFLAQIASHSFVIYLIGTTGTVESTKEMVKAGSTILKARGIGIKVESAGKAFTKAQWFKHRKLIDEPSLYRMFVLETIVNQPYKGDELFENPFGMWRLGRK